MAVLAPFLRRELRDGGRAAGGLDVRAAQRPGTQLVDIYYDLADPDSASLAITVLVSTNGGASTRCPPRVSAAQAGAARSRQDPNKQITWNAGADWSGHYSANVRFRVTAGDAPAPSSMALIPAGGFTMGDCMATATAGIPLHTVYVSAFYMDKYLVTKACGTRFISGPSLTATASTMPVQARRRTTRCRRLTGMTA